MIKAPCKNCPERHEACHDRCEKYRAFRDERVKVNEWLTKANNGAVTPPRRHYSVSTHGYVTSPRGINRKERVKRKAR